MKRFYIQIIALASLLILVAACAASNDEIMTVSKEQLLHHNFVLVSVDGKDYDLDWPAPSLAFNEGMQVAGAVCNRFFGQGELEQGTLTVAKMASTKMACFNDEINYYENLIFKMLNAGAELDYDGQILTLRYDGHTLVYKLRDYVN